MKANPPAPPKGEAEGVALPNIFGVAVAGGALKLKGDGTGVELPDKLVLAPPKITGDGIPKGEGAAVEVGKAGAAPKVKGLAGVTAGEAGVDPNPPKGVEVEGANSEVGAAAAADPNRLVDAAGFAAPKVNGLEGPELELGAPNRLEVGAAEGANKLLAGTAEAGAAPVSSSIPLSSSGSSIAGEAPNPPKVARGAGAIFVAKGEASLLKT